MENPGLAFSQIKLTAQLLNFYIRYNYFMHYKVLYINDRFKENVARSQNILNNAGFILCDIPSFSAKDQDCYKELDRQNIKLWSKQDYLRHYQNNMTGAYTQITPGRIGHWISYINVFRYVYENNIQNFLLLEDDAFLNDNFLSTLNGAMGELPKDYDFLSLFITRVKQLKIDGSIEGKEYIEDCISQKYATLGTVFSYSMAEKMIRFVESFGIGIPTDDMMFYLANKENYLNGYKIKTSIEDIISNLDEFKRNTTIEYNFVS